MRIKPKWNANASKLQDYGRRPFSHPQICTGVRGLILMIWKIVFVTILSATFNQLELKMICGRKHVLKFNSTVIEIHSICTKLSKVKEKKNWSQNVNIFRNLKEEFVPSAKVTWDIDTSRKTGWRHQIQRLTLSSIIPCIHVKLSESSSRRSKRFALKTE